MNLWNNLGFNLYTMPFVCHVVAISNRRKKSEIEVSLIGVLLLNTGDQVQ